MLNRAFVATDFHPVPDRILILHKNEEAVDQIPNQVLRTEGESQTKDGHTTEERPGIDANHIKGDQGTHNVDCDLADTFENVRDRVCTLLDSTDVFGVVVGHHLHQGARNEAHQP